jgi:hypothetical protein
VIDIWWCLSYKPEKQAKSFQIIILVIKKKKYIYNKRFFFLFFFQDFCKERPDGQYPDDNDSSAFIVCSNGMEFKKECPKGLLYNKDLKVCDWPTNVRKLWYYQAPKTEYR